MRSQAMEKLLTFLESSPTAFHAVENTAELLKAHGYTPLLESDSWKLEAGKGYFVTRNQSSIIAFRMPLEKASSFMITASHTDFPTFKLKNEYESPAFDQYIRLVAEPYGGSIFFTWADRPLSIAGRVILEKDGNFLAKTVKIDRDLVLIPNLAIHMNREVNSGFKWNAAVDLLPLFSQNGQGNETLKSLLSKELDCPEEDIRGFDLFLYNRQKGSVWGANEEFFSSPRIDNLMCLWGTLQGLLASEPLHSVNLFFAADNEETGSATKQGAGSEFLSDTISRICEALQADKRQLLASSMMISADNGHAKHPNHPEMSDAKNSPHLNGGVVIKTNAAQKYATDGISCALFEKICKRAEVPVQYYANRSDLPGGSTLGSISNTKVPLITVDIGMAQLAMHSSYETAGCQDIEHLVRAITAFYQYELQTMGDGCYQLLKNGKEVKGHE